MQAGKTETAKIFIRSIVQIARTKRDGVFSNHEESDHTSLEKSIVHMNSILEAFGNAKTTTNFNSSRFGQYLGLQLHSQYVYITTCSAEVCKHIIIRASTPNSLRKIQS